jgi:hypothetical protein
MTLLEFFVRKEGDFAMYKYSRTIGPHDDDCYRGSLKP